MANRLFWCLGMYASASTWLYNVVRQLAEVAQPGQQVRTHFASGRLNEAALAQPGFHIIKTHEISDDAAVQALTRRADKILVTIRDPRDAVTSLILYHGHSFENALPLVTQAMTLCARMAADNRAMLLHYESGFFGDERTLERIAAHLDLTVPKADRRRIFAALQRGQVESFIAGMPRLPGVLQDRVSGDLLDPQTHWHTHHAGRSGEVGRWRRLLTSAQAREVVLRLAENYTFTT
jgi:hypothetical protein